MTTRNPSSAVAPVRAVATALRTDRVADVLRTVAIAFSLLASGCGASDQDTPRDDADSGGVCPTGEYLAAGVCVPRRDACRGAAVPIPGGGCLAVGVPSDGCGAGFEHDGDGGCTAILPAAPCTGPTLAVAGDTSCRPITACGAAPWGDVPTEQNTIYVDAAYAGATTDGSISRPLKTLAEAIGVAERGAIIALAEGTYRGNLVVTNPVRIWGRCPELVTIEGVYLAEDDQDALGVVDAPGTEIRGVTLRAPGAGVLAYETRDLLVSGVRLTGSTWGILAAGEVAEASITLADSLVDDIASTGVLGLGAQVVVERTEFRESRPLGEEDGVAVFIGRFSATSPEPSAVIRGANVSGHVSAAVAMSATLTVEDSVARAFVAGPQGRSFGAVTAILDPDVPRASDVTVRGSVVDGAVAGGVLVGGGRLTLERSVVRATRAADTQDHSVGAVGVFRDEEEAAQGTMRDCLVADNVGVGLFVGEARFTVERSVVRAGVPYEGSGDFGRGVSVEGDTAEAELDLVDSLVADCHEAGVALVGARATLTRTAIRDTRASKVSGLYGDGLVVSTALGPRVARAEATFLTIDGSSRAGVTVFGAELALADSRLSCSTFDLDVEEHYGTDAVGVPLTLAVSVTDSGRNTCGCGDVLGRCLAQSNGLSAAPRPERPAVGP